MYTVTLLQKQTFININLGFAFTIIKNVIQNVSKPIRFENPTTLHFKVQNQFDSIVGIHHQEKCHIWREELQSCSGWQDVGGESKNSENTELIPAELCQHWQQNMIPRRDKGFFIWYLMNKLLCLWFLHNTFCCLSHCVHMSMGLFTCTALLILMTVFFKRMTIQSAHYQVWPILTLNCAWYQNIL